MRDFAGGQLISAEKGLFLAREQDGKVTVAPVGADTGPAHAEGIHPLPGGGALIGTTWKRWFVARAAGGTVTLTPAGVADPGRISLMRDLPVARADRSGARACSWRGRRRACGDARSGGACRRARVWPTSPT